MARVPLIERPCPLSSDEQRRIAGHCTRCARDVHVLDGLDDAARLALLAGTSGPMCVRYRVQRSPGAAMRASALGVALAASLAAPGVAADPARVLAPSAAGDGGVLSAPAQPAQMSPVASGVPPEEEIIFVGGVASAADAHWVDDSALPSLPVRVVTGRDDDWGTLADGDEPDARGG